MTFGKNSENSQSENLKDFEILKKFAFIKNRLNIEKKNKSSARPTPPNHEGKKTVT